MCYNTLHTRRQPPVHTNALPEKTMLTKIEQAQGKPLTGICLLPAPHIEPIDMSRLAATHNVEFPNDFHPLVFAIKNDDAMVAMHRESARRTFRDLPMHALAGRRIYASQDYAPTLGKAGEVPCNLFVAMHLTRIFVTGFTRGSLPTTLHGNKVDHAAWAQYVQERSRLAAKMVVLGYCERKRKSLEAEELCIDRTHGAMKLLRAACPPKTPIMGIARPQQQYAEAERPEIAKAMCNRIDIFALYGDRAQESTPTYH